MITLFKSKEPTIKIIDRVAFSESAKLEAMMTQWDSDKNTAFVFWFDESLRRAKLFFAGQTIEPVTLLSVREANNFQLQGGNAFFAEHYPLRSIEEEFYKKMKIKVLTIFSSLNEPLFNLFGAGKIIKAVKRLGIKGSEVIQHKLISKAIRNTQEKIEKKVLIDPSAQSQQEWLEKNFTH